MSILICGIVSQRDDRPYIQIDVDGRMLQLTMAQARTVARDIESMCARTEANAMLHKFFSKSDFPKEAAVAIMFEFRRFRSDLDVEKVERFEDP